MCFYGEQINSYLHRNVSPNLVKRRYTHKHLLLFLKQNTFTPHLRCDPLPKFNHIFSYTNWFYGKTAKPYFNYILNF